VRHAITVLVFAVSIAGPLGAQARDSLPPTISLPAELARVLTDYESAWPRGGAVVAELFVDDGYVLSAGVPPIRGRAAIAKHYGASNGPLALRAFAYAREGNTAFILGAYAAHRGDPDIGKFTLTLRRRADGRWMIVSDMDNGNTRPNRPST
jgi:ketosteroid isomerase-like protein